MITRDDLLELRERPVHGGVLSIYLSRGERSRAPGARGTTALNAGLREVLRACRDDRALVALTERARRLYARLSREDRQRHLALLLCADPEWSWWRSLHLPLGDRFVWMDTPYLRPLVSLLDHAPVVGVVVVTQGVVRVLTWRQGLLEEDGSHPFEVSRADWRRYAGPAPSHPGMSQQTSTHIEKYEDRVAVHLRRFMEEMAVRVATLADSTGWEALVALGPPVVTESLTRALPAPWPGRRVPAPPLNVGRARPTALNAEVTAAVDAWIRHRDAREVEDVLRLVAAGGPASASPQECLDLLAQHRVAHLYFASDLRLKGHRRPDGALVLESGAPARPEWVPEPHVVERMIGAALDQGIPVTPLQGAPAERVLALGGVCARLRY